MRLLATRHCFREVDLNVFANNRLSLVLHSESDQHMSSFVKLFTGNPKDGARDLPNTLSDPKYALSVDLAKSPFMHFLNRPEGTTFYDVLTGDPHQRNALGRGMLAVNKILGTLSVIKEYPWSNVKTLCDVGSGVGTFAWPLLKTYPEINVTLLDLPEVIELAKEHCKHVYPDIYSSNRAIFAPGDFLTEIPSKEADIYYIQNTINNWPDAHVLKILQNIRAVMSPTSRLVIHDIIMQPSCRTINQKPGNLGYDIAPEPLLPNHGAGNIRVNNQDLTMLILFNAKQRTVDELSELSEQAGLKLDKVWDLGESSLVEFVAKVNV